MFEISAIESVLTSTKRVIYKANILTSCMSNATLTVLLTSRMPAVDLVDFFSILGNLKEHCNAGRNGYV